MSEKKSNAKSEIHKTLSLCNFCTLKLGLSFINKPPKNLLRKIVINSWLMASTIILFLKVAGEIGYVITKFVTSPSVVELVSSLHIVGYDAMSFGKLLTIWYKRDMFRHLLKDLEDIWPVSIRDKDAANIKRKRLSALRIAQFWYTFCNLLGVWLFNLTPIAVYVYKKIQYKPASLGYVFLLSYPFDKTKPGYHEAVYIFEAYGGVVSIYCMLSSDMLLMTMTSHISMLLQILQVKIRKLGASKTSSINEERKPEIKDCYSEIVRVIKIHQRLITYGNKLDDAFSIVNLINVLLSSVNICCVVFNILLDPWMVMNNKIFLCAALIQIGILCWYADDICTSSLGVGDAVYESEWYNTNVRCHRTLHVLMQRSQKPLYITAFKFSFITTATFSSILNTSYSYFMLLYSVYHSD